MSLNRVEPRLRVKEHELLSTLAALGGETRLSGELEVRDQADAAHDALSTAESTEAASVLSQTLAEVRRALRRLEDGSYGKCVICGRAIERARLNAIPWTPYCLEDQEKQDLKPAQPDGLAQWQSA